MKKKAYAKINLFLDILFKREDNYHELNMVMQSISLHDVIKIKKSKQGIKISCTDKSIPLDKRNIVYKAVEIFKEYTHIKYGVKIVIKKNIPTEAGLAGGSTDAATTLILLNNIFKTKLSISKLEKMALEIGSDVPFCISGGIKKVQGKGEILKRIKNLPRTFFVLVKPSINISTKEAYSLFDKNVKKRNIESILKVIELENIEMISNQLYNEFEEYLFPRNSQLVKLKNDINDTGALGCLMTGSGSVVYGVYKNRSNAKMAYSQLNRKYNNCFICHNITKQ